MGKHPISIISGLGYRPQEQGAIPIKTFRFNRIDMNAPFVGVPWEHPFRRGQGDLAEVSLYINPASPIGCGPY